MFKTFWCGLRGHRYEVIKYMVTPFQIIYDERCIGCGDFNSDTKLLSVHVERRNYNPIGVVTD